MPIHPTAIVDPKAELDRSVEVGPYAIIEGPARIGAGSRISGHAYVTGFTRIGENCAIHPFAVVGHLPQDFHFGGERSYCTLGDRVIVREGATIHRGTQPESETYIGDDCFLMAQSHVGHNCRLGRGVKIMNFAAVAGHVEIGDLATLSASALVHQFVRVGQLAFVAGGTRATMDVPPFLMAYGESSVIQHNHIGMRRAGYTSEEIHEIREAYSTLYRSGLTFRKAVDLLAGTVRTRSGLALVEFLRAESRRGCCSGGTTQRQRPILGEAPPPDLTD